MSNSALHYLKHFPAMAIAFALLATGSALAQQDVASPVGVRVGERFAYTTLNPMNKRPLGEGAMLVTAVNADEVEFDNGALVIDNRGNWRQGAGAGLRYQNVFRPASQPGASWTAQLWSTDGLSTAKVTVRHMSTESYQAGRVQGMAVRLAIRGHANGAMQGPATGTVGNSAIRGEFLLDAATGTPLGINLETKVDNLSIWRVFASRT